MTLPNVTNLVKFEALLLLYIKPRSGYDLMKHLHARTGKKISPGHIYPWLTDLEKKKMLKVKEKGSRDRKEYSLTPAGKKWARGFVERFTELVDATVEQRLHKCVHCECVIYRGGYNDSIRGKKMIFCCSACAHAYKKGGNHHD